MALVGIGSRVEGTHAVAGALAAGRVERLTVERRRRAALADLLQSASGVAVIEVEDLAALAETAAPQGVIADCRAISSWSLEELIGSAGPAAVVVLDHVEDPHNLGAVARSALAAGATGMVVASRRSAPLGATAFKAAVGALERLPVAVVNSIADTITRLDELEVWTVGLSADADESLFGCPLLSEPVAVVVGGEGRGLSRLAAKRVSKQVSIPMAVGVESLNVSVAAGLAMYEIRRVRRDRSR